MRTTTMVSVIICIISVVGLSYAQDENLNEEKRFSNETSLSLVNTTGNTDTLSFAGKNDMTYKFSEKWTGSWLVGAIYNETNSQKETERYFTDLRADYAISDRLYAYGLGSWFQDKFSGFDNRIGIGPGFGYKSKSGDHWNIFVDTTEKVKKAFDAQGITIPFPQRDVHIYEHKTDHIGETYSLDSNQ